MQKLLLKCLVLVMVSSCISTAHQPVSETRSRNSLSALPPVSSSFSDVDTTLITQPQLPEGARATSLTDLPRTEDGAFLLTPGLYETDFKTYCLQPGTPGPSSSTVYFQAPLQGSRKVLIEDILLNSRKKAYLNQQHVQLLLWSVVSHSDFYKLAPEVQSTAVQLVSPKQLFELQGGIVGVMRTAAKVLPATGGTNDIRRLFETGITSYEAYERIAVINTPAQLHRTDLKQDQWYRHEEGYYVRYLPDNYKKTRIQVYVPGTPVDTTVQQPEYIVFDPASWVVVPANSNAQRLGIGGPVLDIIRKVIHNAGTPKGKPFPVKKPQDKAPN